MRQKAYVIALAIIFALACSSTLWSQGFLKLGPRALGLAGAYVAAADDSTAVYWNPAGVSYYLRNDITFSGGLHLTDEGEFIDQVNEFLSLDVYQGESYQRAITLLHSLAQEEIDLKGQGSMGLLVTGSAWGFSILETAHALIMPRIDLDNIDLDPASENFLVNNQSSLRFVGLRTREYILSLSYPFLVDNLFVGINLKYIKGQTYFLSKNLFTELLGQEVEARDLVDEALGQNRISDSAFSIDLGALLELGSYGRLGIVGRNLRKPTFKLAGDEELKLDTQWRAGVAIYPVPSLLISMDIDLKENRLGKENPRSQELAFGLEKSFLNHSLFVRGGGCVNLKSENKQLAYAAGFGFRVNKVFFNIAVLARPGWDEVGAAAEIAVRF
ncbi:MAG: conjugal transfer protein TraF [Candidatus Aminicenantes bacterium]|nr:conjugal transfer protein TraF [Candidatus Aminicenantes bacterium]MDH5715123.1 conjugal transfer protein TraF [Candidatus Aminicenantes bacterium]